MDTTAAMLDYYRQRAAYYERVYHKPHRQTELRAMEAWLPPVFVGRRVLEIACGTGWWTPHGARDASRWLAIDANEATLDVARSKPLPACVELRAADAYTLAELGDERFDAAFAGCWWSHVPKQRLDAWLDTLHAKLLPGAVVVLLDNRYVEHDSTPLSRYDEHGNGYQSRRLDDGSTHEVLKNFPIEAELRERLAGRVRAFEWAAWPHYWACRYELI
jgi:demethylmenaquinone methyltransferase/2-methoxy-6-polyprenyl-1,4-benzoquinol methylase